MNTKISKSEAEDLAEELVDEFINIFDDEGIEIWPDVIPDHKELVLDLLKEKVIEVLKVYLIA